MSLYAKIEHNLYENPKIVGLSDAAFRAYVESILYSGKHLTDGFLDERIVSRMWGADVAAELSANDPVNPSWTRVDGGWKIYGFCERQTTKADVDAMKEQKSRAGKASAEARRNRKDTQIEQSVEHNGNITSTETQPDTDTDTNTNTNTNTKSTRATRLPETWNIGNELYSWTQAEAPNLNMAREAAKFRDYWLSVPGQKGTKTDWDRTWKNWVRNNVERNPALAVVSQQPTKRKITGYDD